MIGIAFADDPGDHRDWGRYYDTNSAISGTVMDESSAPLADAIVTVSHIGLPVFSRKDTTDATGTWFADGLMAGFYLIQAEKADYLTQYYDHSESFLKAKVVTLAKKDTLEGITFNLAQGAAISGTVYAADGVTPLAGAIVSLSRLRDSRDQLSARQAVSDANGHYRIGGLASGGYQVMAVREGYLPEYYQEAARRSDADTVQVTAPAEMTGINFSLAQTSAITGLITAEVTSTPVANAWIVAYNRSSFSGKHLMPAGKARSDENGLYIMTLPPGSYLLTAEATGYVAEWFDNAATVDLATPVEVKSGEHTLASFALKGWGGLSGKVSDAVTAAPIAGALIQAFNEEKRVGQLRSFEATSLEDGSYAFPGLPSGRYIVVAKAPGYLKEYWQEADSLRNATIITMENGTPVSGIDFTLGTGGSIEGVVTDAADNLPIADVRIEIQSRNGRIKMRGVSDAEGKYAIKGLEGGSYLVSAVHAGYVSQWYDSVATRREATAVEVLASQAATGIDFVLSKVTPLPRSISGLVVDDSTSLPIQNALILAIPVRSFHRPRKALSAEDGTYLLSGLPAGSYVLLVDARGYKGEFYDNVRSWKEAKAIEVIEGQEVTGIDIGLAPQLRGAYQIAGKVVDAGGAPVEGALVTLTAEGENVASMITAEDGDYCFDGIPADSYALTASAAGYEDSAPAAESLALGGTINVYGLNLLVTDQATAVGENPALPVTSGLEQNYPNPFNPSTRIDFALAQAGTVRLTVYDILGREVKRIVQGELPAGKHSAIWDGTDNRGEKMASGVYFYRLQVDGKADSFSKMRRMLLIK
jgi:hypothetical protein